MLVMVKVLLAMVVGMIASLTTTNPPFALTELIDSYFTTSEHYQTFTHHLSRKPTTQSALKPPQDNL